MCRASGREAKTTGPDAVAKSGGTARPSANQRVGLAFFLLTPKPMASPLPNEAQLVILWSVHGRVNEAPLEPISMDDVDRLSPLDFEALIAALFDSMGHASVLTTAGNDGGADVVAFRHGEITLIQVKHSHSGLHVGKAAVGDLVGASNTYNVALRHSVRMAVVTNTRLTSDAESECRSLGIDFIARAELARHLKQHPILLTDVLKQDRLTLS